MEEKGKEREREGWNRKGGWLTCNCTTSTCSFHPFLSVREACEHKGCFRGKKQFQYLAQKNFFFFSGKGNIDSWICIGNESNGNKLEDQLSAVENNFYEALEDNSMRMNFIETFPSLRSWRSRNMDKFQFCFQCLE